MPTICTWWIILCRLIETVATILGSAYICMQIICDCISELTTFFSVLLKFSPNSSGNLGLYKLSGLIRSSRIVHFLFVMEKSLSVNWGSHWNFGKVIHLQIGDVIDFHIVLLIPHLNPYAPSTFCFNNVNCHDRVLFRKLAGACSL